MQKEGNCSLEKYVNKILGLSFKKWSAGKSLVLSDFVLKIEKLFQL